MVSTWGGVRIASWSAAWKARQELGMGVPPGHGCLLSAYRLMPAAADTILALGPPPRSPEPLPSTGCSRVSDEATLGP